jgi:hypothetical protein
MFTALSNTRNSSLYLIAALATMAVVLLTFAVVPVISAPKPAPMPVIGVSAVGSDYYERHLELRVPGLIDMSGDFFRRHPEWAANVQSAAIPVTGLSEASDYFQRHSELIAPAGIAVDATDYFLRHPELSVPAETVELSDYFLRH